MKIGTLVGIGSLLGAVFFGCGGGAGDGPSGSNAETDYTQTKTITMDAFTVPPNSEVFYCQTFANPWGKQVDVKTYDLTMSAGSHHMFAFYQQDAKDAPVATCPAGGLTFGAFTFGSQSPSAVETYPDTIGATIPQGTGFNLMAHYLNATTAPVTAHVSLTMSVAKAGLVSNHVGVLFLNDLGITVPPTGKPVVTTSSMTLGQDVNVLTAQSHMHKFGTNFISTATTPGGKTQTLFSTKQWSEPKAVKFSTPLHLTSGTTLTWSCTDVNTTGQTLTFGEYALTNVMCISIETFYPVQDVNNPVLGL